MQTILFQQFAERMRLQDSLAIEVRRRILFGKDLRAFREGFTVSRFRSVSRPHPLTDVLKSQLTARMRVISFVWWFFGHILAQIGTLCLFPCLSKNFEGCETVAGALMEEVIEAGRMDSEWASLRNDLQNLADFLPFVVIGLGGDDGEWGLTLRN
jgi:hypothetical protein